MRTLLIAITYLLSACVVGDQKPDVPETQPALTPANTASEPHYGAPHAAEALAAPPEVEPWRPVNPKVPLEATGAASIARQAAWVHGRNATVTTVDKQGGVFAVALKDSQGRELHYAVDATTAEVKESK